MYVICLAEQNNSIHVSVGSMIIIQVTISQLLVWDGSMRLTQLLIRTCMPLIKDLLLVSDQYVTHKIYDTHHDCNVNEIV